MSKKSEPVMTLEKRMLLKRSLDDGITRIFDTTDKRNRTLPDVLDNPESLFIYEKEKEAGKGAYGQVKLLQDRNDENVAVAKITGCRSILTGDPFTSPFRSEQIEPRILNFLWKHMVETRVTPHIIAPVGTHAIVNGFTEEQKKDDSELENSLIFFMERATCSDLRSHFFGLVGVEFHAQFKSLVFQVCFTLASILLRFPNFRHNDLKANNVMLHKSTNVGFTRYKIYGKTFMVPNVGCIALLSDFDLACMEGYTFDNYKTMELEWELPR